MSRSKVNPAERPGWYLHQSVVHEFFAAKGIHSYEQVANSDLIQRKEAFKQVLNRSLGPRHLPTTFRNTSLLAKRIDVALAVIAYQIPAQSAPVPDGGKTYGEEVLRMMIAGEVQGLSADTQSTIDLAWQCRKFPSDRLSRISLTIPAENMAWRWLLENHHVAQTYPLKDEFGRPYLGRIYPYPRFEEKVITKQLAALRDTEYKLLNRFKRVAGDELHRQAKRLMQSACLKIRKAKGDYFRALLAEGEFWASFAIGEDASAAYVREHVALRRAMELYMLRRILYAEERRRLPCNLLWFQPIHDELSDTLHKAHDAMLQTPPRYQLIRRQIASKWELLASSLGLELPKQ